LSKVGLFIIKGFSLILVYFCKLEEKNTYGFFFIHFLEEFGSIRI
jgi:hypothetical protein